MKRLVAALLLAPALAAQVPTRPPLDQRLDAQTLALVRPILDAARADSIPVWALEDKALEGAAKGIAPPRIDTALRQLAAALKEARGVMRDARGGTVPPDVEIAAAADALRRSVPAADIGALRRNVPSEIPLAVPLTVLGDLVQRGIPSEYARSLIERLVDAGVTLEQLAQIPARVDVALRVGAPPLQALESALPIPLKPVPPQQAPAQRPRPRVPGSED